MAPSHNSFSSPTFSRIFHPIDHLDDFIGHVGECCEVRGVGGRSKNHSDVGWEALEKQLSQKRGVGLSCVVPEELLPMAE